MHLLASRGLGALIAKKFAAEGCQVAINYVSNLERAKETAEQIDRAFKIKPVILQGVSLLTRTPLLIPPLMFHARTWACWRIVRRLFKKPSAS